MSDDGERHAAMVEFVGIFETVQSPPAALADLSDGVALFEALSEM
jgi:protein HOOK3